MASLFGKPAATGSGVIGDLAKDVQLASPPEDSISALSWSPVANHLAVSSWDNKVRIYDVTSTPTGNGVAAMDFASPVLACDWSKVCRFVLSFLDGFADTMPGRTESGRCWLRQNCKTPRSRLWGVGCPAGSCPRCTYPYSSVRRRSKFEQCYARDGLLGQDHQILGSANFHPCRFYNLSGEGICDGREGQAPSYCNG